MTANSVPYYDRNTILFDRLGRRRALRRAGRNSRTGQPGAEQPAVTASGARRVASQVKEQRERNAILEL